MLLKILHVGLGAFLGGILRYSFLLVGQYFHVSSIYTILLINLLGCFLLGYYGIILKIEGSHYFWLIGFLGAFTTFATFIADIYHLFPQNKLYASLYLIFSLVGGILFFLFGIWLYQYRSV